MRGSIHQTHISPLIARKLLELDAMTREHIQKELDNYRGTLSIFGLGCYIENRPDSTQVHLVITGAEKDLREVAVEDFE